MKKLNFTLSLFFVSSMTLINAGGGKLGRLVEIKKAPGVTTQITLEAIQGGATIQHSLLDEPFSVPKTTQGIKIITTLRGNLEQEIAVTGLHGSSNYRVLITSQSANTIDFESETIPPDDAASEDDNAKKEGEEKEEAEGDGDSAKQSQVARLMSSECAAPLSLLSGLVRNRVSEAASGAMTSLSTAAASLYAQVPCMPAAEKKEK